MCVRCVTCIIIELSCVEVAVYVVSSAKFIRIDCIVGKILYFSNRLYMSRLCVRKP